MTQRGNYKNLFDGQTADGNSSTLTLYENTNKTRKGTFWVKFNSGTGTVKLQEAPSASGPWYDVTGTSTTSDATAVVDSPMSFLRANLASSASTPNIDAGFHGA